MKQLISLISTENKTVEQIHQELQAALDKFRQAEVQAQGVASTTTPTTDRNLSKVTTSSTTL